MAATESDTAPSAADPVTERALALLREHVPDAVIEAETGGAHPWIRVAPEHLRAACVLVRDHEDLQMDCCHLISGVDHPEAGEDGEIEVVYHLCSYGAGHETVYRDRAPKNDAWLALKVRVPRDRAEVPTVMDLWTGADWHERETWDLVGVRFTGRRELRRILLPDDWPGHPLRKDWEYPASYHGVPIIPPEGL